MELPPSSLLTADEAIQSSGNLVLRPASDEMLVDDAASPQPLALAHEAFHEGRRPMPLWRDCLLGRCRARDGINVSLYLRLGAIKQRSKILPRRTNRDHREMTRSSSSRAKASSERGGPNCPVEAFIKEIARLNRRAASWTAFAALLEGLATIAHYYGR